MRLGVLAHFLDLVFAQTAAGSDGDLLLLAGAKVFGADVEDTIGVDIEGNFDLRHAARRRRNICQMKLADSLIVTSQLAFALKHMNFDARLVIRRRRENL